MTDLDRQKPPFTLPLGIKIAVAVVYAAVMIWLLYFGENREAGKRGFNLIPMHTLSYMMRHTANRYPSFVAINILGNILLFIPPGIILPSIFKKRKIWELFLFCVVSICLVEALQYFLGVGIMDIDDVILNSAGVLCGLLFYAMRRYLIRKRVASIKE